MTSRFVIWATFVFFFNPAFGEAGSTFGQAAKSENRVTGTVRDATGIGVPGATVTVTNRTTKEARTATTGQDGNYSVNVPIGPSSVTVALPGFRAALQTVDVSAGAPVQVNITLETALTEEITVTATKREQTLARINTRARGSRRSATRISARSISCRSAPTRSAGR